MPASPEHVRAGGARRLVDAVAHAAGAGPELGRDEWSIRVRRAAAHLALEADIHLDELAYALGITRDATRKIGLRRASAELLTATRLRLALEDAAARAAAALAVSQTRKAPSHPVLGA
ncbi:MAG: hypothetical protein Q8P18_27700 [Pseudomonadota bacterium]|nr:hypothetical protein [Pseudomonadota bacterium]